MQNVSEKQQSSKTPSRSRRYRRAQRESRFSYGALTRLIEDVTAPTYAVPSEVADEASHERYHHLDLPKLDDATLSYELRLTEEALVHTPRSEWISREWWAARREAVRRELRRLERGPAEDRQEVSSWIIL